MIKSSQGSMPGSSHHIVTEENFYRSLFENAAVGIGRTDWDTGRVLYANTRLAEILGYDDRDEFVRDFNFADHYPDEGGRQRQLEFYQQSPGKLVEAVFTRKDESLVYVQAEVRVDTEQGYIDFVIIDSSERHAAELALQESIEAKSQAENLTQTMIEHSPIPISVKDLNGKYLYISHAYNKYLDVDADDVLGKDSADFLSAELSNRIHRADAQVETTGMPLEADQSFPIHFHESTLQVSKFPIFDSKGKVCSIATIGIDITELENTRKELDRRSGLLEESEKIAKLGHWQWDEVSHELVVCSRQAASIFELTVEQMYEQVNTHEKMLSFVHTEDRDLVHQQVWAFVNHTQDNPDDTYSVTFEYRLQLPGNNIRYLRETMGVEIDNQGHRVRSVGTIQDVTELTRAHNELQQHRNQLELLVTQRNEELRESEEVFRSFYEVIPDISMITDLEDGIVKSVNKGFTDTTGYTRDEIVGQSTLNLDLWRDNADRDRLVAGLSKEGKVSNLDADFRRKDGSFWPGIMAACIIQLDGKPHILSTTKDISELRRIQDMAIKANQAKSQFLSAMSHELRTPLNAILGFTQVLQMSENLALTDRQQKAFATIHKSGEHLLQLINRILELSSIEAGDLHLDLRPTEPAPLIEESIEMLAGASQLKSIKIVNNTTALNLPLVYTDAIRTRQILLNLLSNAIKYNDDHGSVVVLAEVVNNARLRISIIDSGHGFTSEAHARIFEPFDRLDQADSETAGAGIGLSIAKQLIEAIGGAIGFTSEPDSGSHFWIDLPLSETTAQLETVLPEPDQTPVPHEKTMGFAQSRRILYIEDNVINFELMEDIFEDIDNTELLHTRDAESGIEMARENPPDLILMDISLPGMDGIEATRMLKSLPETRAIPVIGISAAALVDDVERAMGAGFHAYKTKPFQIDDFLETIRKVLNQVNR